MSNELIQKLIIEAAQRFGSVHQNPEIAAISFVEMQELTEKYKTSILLEAFRRAGSCVKKEKAITHERILKAVYNLAERVLAQDTRSKPTVRPQTRPAPKADTALTGLRVEFQNHATLQDWTLTEDQAAEYLHQAGSIEVMCEAMLKLRKYPISEFEEGLSALGAAIDQTLWTREAVALTT